MKPLLALVPLLLASLASAVVPASIQLPAPSAPLSLNVRLKEGQLFYSVAYRGCEVLVESGFELVLTNAPKLGLLSLERTHTNTHDSTWQPVYGERSEIRDHYNELLLDVREDAELGRRLRFTFRVYNEGVAFAYSILKTPGVDRVHIAAEKAEFRFSADHPCWAVYTAQGKYAEVPLSQVRSGCERPLVIRVAPDVYTAIGEARLVNYARMKFAPLKGVPHGIVSELSGAVTNTLPLQSPWRFVMVAETPAKLLENNFMVLNLNDPCAIVDTSWIRPGKVIREVTLTTAGGKACVDFAAKRNLQYVEFDAGWYGDEYNDSSDASGVHVDPKRSKGPLDLQEVIDYGKARGIGIILYVNRRALEKQLHEILPLYRKWGVKGVKYGFVNVGSQQWTTWLHDAIREAARHQLMVDVHDEYRPTGFTRTYPNLMTQEGIGGDETSPSNDQTLTLQFTRMLAGAADNTICYFDARVDKNATHAYQLAKAVCLYSPWQFLYWYDRPKAAPQKVGGAGNAESGIADVPELEFYDAVPTVWDDTRVLEGSIGKFAVVARRSKSEWYIGAMNSGEARAFDVKLTFLDPKRKYVAHIYSDDPSVRTRTHVRVDQGNVDANSLLKINCSERGGQAVRIVPEQ